MYSATYKKYANFEIKNKRICRQFIRGYVLALPFIKTSRHIKELSKHLGRRTLYIHDMQTAIHILKIETIEGIEDSIKYYFADKMHRLAGSRFIDAVLFIEELEQGVLCVGFLMVAWPKEIRTYKPS